MYKIILAVRYLVKRPITFLAVLAVALCVFVIVVVMTVMTGLVRDFKIKNHNWVGDCVVSSDSLVGFPYYEEFLQILEAEDSVAESSPVIRSYGILQERSGWSGSVEIMGIDPARHSRVTSFGETLHYHSRLPHRAFVPDYDANLPGAVIGIDKFRQRDENGQYHHEPYAPKYVFSVSCFPLTAKGGLAKAGLGLVNTKTFYYSDDSRSGLANVDSRFLYLPFEHAQALCGMQIQCERASGIHVRFEQGADGKAGCERIASLWKQFVEKKQDAKYANLLANVTVQSWRSYRRQAVAAMEKEQIMMTAVFAMMAVITVFIVFVVFYMIIAHKSKDIGILKSIGVMERDIIKLFLTFAFLVGVVGSAVGTAGGIIFLAKVNQIEKWLYENYGFQLWNRMIYVIGDIPNKIELRVLATIIISAIAACLVGALLPSWQGARLKPVQTLQVSQL